MFKYDLHVHEWHGDVNNIYKKIKTKCTLNYEHLANLYCVQELFKMRDVSDYELLPRSVITNMLHDISHMYQFSSYSTLIHVVYMYVCACVYIYTHAHIYGCARICVYVCNKLCIWCVWTVGVQYIHYHCINMYY